MDDAEREALRTRAGGICEYCHISDRDDRLPFQPDHIIAIQHGGSDDPDNLAYTCVSCNKYKGPNVAGINPATHRAVRLFHPRRDRWKEHFRWDGSVLVGKTVTAQVTISLLRINRPERVELRRRLMRTGRFKAD